MPTKKKLSPLSQSIQDALDHARITHEKLGEELGISYSAVSKILKNSSYSAKQLEIISKFLNMEFKINEPPNPSGLTNEEQASYNTNVMIEMMEKVIAAQADAIKAKDELIANLKENQKK